MQQDEENSRFLSGWLILAILLIYISAYVFAALEDLYDLNIF